MTALGILALIVAGLLALRWLVIRFIDFAAHKLAEDAGYDDSNRGDSGLAGFFHSSGDKL